MVGFFVRSYKISMNIFSKIFIIYLSIEASFSKTLHPYPTEKGSRQAICYEHLGCFDILPPFSPAMPLPASPEKVQTEYFLRTRKNLHDDQAILPEAENLAASFFDSTKPTKIIIHGFVMTQPEHSHLPQWVKEVTDTILYQEDVNVIQIYWVKGAAVEYDQAASNTRLVGAQVGYLVKMLMEVHNIRADNFHLVGFSLGAHVAGFAGKFVQKSGKKNLVGRITGLDPANPGFNYDSTAVRLDKTDAKFVDVIHTDTNTVLAMATGMNRNLGHIDFYPNGGAEQTGCHKMSEDSSFLSVVTGSTVCDHLRAPQLFKHSINATGDHPHMLGFKCDNYDKFKRGICLRCSTGNRCRRMGYWAEPPTHNEKQLQYYLVTSGEAPFTVKHFKVQIHWRNSTSATKEGFKARLFLTLHGDKGSTPEISLNEAHTFHVHAGETTRFLVTQDTNNDIGNLQRITFRWERPSCWTYFFCPDEDINLKRIRIFDATTQEGSLFLPLGSGRDEHIKSHFVKPGEHFELLRTSYIRRSYPGRYKTLDKEEATIKDSENVIHPSIIPVANEKVVTLPIKPVTQSTSLLTSSPSSTTQSAEV